MSLRHVRNLLAASAVSGLPGLVGAQAEPPKGGSPPTGKPAEARSVKASLAERLAETQQLGDRATKITKDIGELASSGKIPRDEQAMDAMRKMVDELTEINRRLKLIEEEIVRIQRYLEGLDEAVPKLRKDVDNLLRHKEGNYVQFQYRATDQRGVENASFRMRRVRVGFTDKIDAKTSMKISVDFAATPNLIGPAGSSVATANTDQNAQLKDAYLDYRSVPATALNSGVLFRFGQQNMPLGYEIERSSSEREFPERSIYNNVLFPGERNRGILGSYGFNPSLSGLLGVFNSTSVNDPEQRTILGSPGSRLGVTGGLRWQDRKYSFGLSGFAASRVGQQVGYDGATGEKVFAPEADRRLLYADATIINLFGTGTELRTEGMVGRDRPGVSPVTVSSGSTSAGITDPNSPRLRERPVAGWQIQLARPINARNRIAFRYEQFDPDLDNGGNLARGYGAAWLYFINPAARITFAYEVFQDEARSNVNGKPDTRYSAFTIRLQYKF